MENRIFFKKHDDINWPFHEKPSVSLETKPYGTTQEVDPFPCYSHNEELVRNEIAYIEKVLPLPYMPQWFILSHEGPCRTNGWAADNKDYQWDKATDKRTEIPMPYIGIYAKRIPPMQSLTRYLLAHEYSHIVDYNLRHLMQCESQRFHEIYAGIRGIQPNQKYGALNWHNNIGEIFANDVRIIVFNKEGEFWPHNVPHPMEDETFAKLYPWFKEKFKEYLKVNWDYAR